MSDLIERLRRYSDQLGGITGEAADMLDFFFERMQMCSPKMNGQHSYVFRSSGWPMTHCKGPNAEEAVRAAMAEVRRSQDEMLPKLSDLKGLFKDSPVDVADGWEEPNPVAEYYQQKSNEWTFKASDEASEHKEVEQ